MDEIFQKLSAIERLIADQQISQKEVLSLKEAALYLQISASHLYKLTHGRQLVSYCPGGKLLYFKKTDLDNWRLSNRRSTLEEISATAASLVTLKLGRRSK